MKYRAFIFGLFIILAINLFAFTALDAKFVSTITMSPTTANPGDEVTFTVNFKPVGAIVTNYKTVGGIDTPQIFQRVFASIPADAVRTLSFKWTATAGNHTVWFELDPEHKSNDTDYTNNRIEKAFVVQQIAPAGKPNLTVDATYSPSPATNGADIAFSATVTNSGNAASAPCKLGFYVFGAQQKEFNIPALDPGQNANFTHTWVAECQPPCNAYVSFSADSGSVVDESNEKDNVWVKMDICDCPVINPQLTNLKVSATYTPTSFKNGDKVQFNIAVTNTTSIPSPEVHMSFSDISGVRQTYKVISVGALQTVYYVFEWIASCNASCRNKFDIFIDNQKEAEESTESDNHWTQNAGCKCLNTLPNTDNIFDNKNANQKIIRGKGFNLTLDPGSLVYSCSTDVMFVKFKVKNMGITTSSASHVQIQSLDGGNVLYSTIKAIPKLGPGKTQEIILHGLNYVNNGQIVIKIDCYNEAIESDETDNLFNETIIY